MRRSARRLLAMALLLGGPAVTRATAQPVTQRHDDTFRKYSKRFFGPAFDWRVFKAQGMAESNLNMRARSWVGARGIMQLMPSTFAEVASRNPELLSIDDPEWNIAAGIFYDRRLWQLWTDNQHEGERQRFMLGSYNAGRSTMLRAQGIARLKALDPHAWPSIARVAPEVPRWRHRETLGYVDRIESHFLRMDARGLLP